MNTKTATKIDLHSARGAVENVLAEAALTVWEDIAASIEEHGEEQTATYLEGHLAPHFRTQRLSSRSTSTISNLLDDMKFGIYTAAFFVIREEIKANMPRWQDAGIAEVTADIAKEVRRAGRHYAANI